MSKLNFSDLSIYKIKVEWESIKSPETQFIIAFDVGDAVKDVTVYIEGNPLGNNEIGEIVSVEFISDALFITDYAEELAL